MFGGAGRGAPGGAGPGLPHPIDMMFMPGGMPAGGLPPGVDPFVLFSGLNGFGEFYGMPQAEQQHDARKGPPPTSKSVLQSLPRIKVTTHDIEANESTECSICLDELVVGQPALRIPCGHLYHEECVKDWLQKSNECPVCRYELPTDDAEYERGRRTRMAGRKIRMRRSDLTVKTAQELRRLADHIGVDVRDCLEKGELVERIAAHSKVELIAEDGMEVTDDGNATSSTGPPMFSLAQLSCMPIDELKAVLESLNVAADSDDTQELIRRLVLSGAVQIVANEEAPASPNTSHRPIHTPAAAAAPPPAAFAASAAFSSVASAGAGQASPAAAASGASRPPPEELVLTGKSVGELKQIARRLGVSLDGCLEKADIVQRIEAATNVMHV